MERPFGNTPFFSQGYDGLGCPGTCDRQPVVAEVLSDNLVSQIKTDARIGLRQRDGTAWVLEICRWLLGGDGMRNLAKICAVVALCLGLAGAAGAVDRPRPGLARAKAGRLSTAQVRPSKPSPVAGRPHPVASVSVPQTPLYFGKVAGGGPTQLKAETTVKVTANCPFRLMASFRGLTGGATDKVAIPPKLMKVTINGKEVPIGTEFVEIATGGPTTPVGADVPVVVELKTAGVLAYPAGQYGGNLAFTVRGG